MGLDDRRARAATRPGLVGDKIEVSLSRKAWKRLSSEPSTSTSRMSAS
jgi:hypothetical protein